MLRPFKNPASTTHTILVSLSYRLKVNAANMTATFDADIQKTALDKKPDLCACIFSQEIRRAPLPVRTACPDCHFAF